jgi:CheY-like chemotaxis protein
MTSVCREQPLILVCDDEQVVLDEIASLLATNGFLCQSCSTAADAIALAESLLPDLILSDLNLPGESALAMCDRIKQIEALADVPVMFLSGNQIPDIIRRHDGNGGTYYLRKPLDPGVLVELIDKALQRRRPLALAAKS